MSLSADWSKDVKDGTIELDEARLVEIGKPAIVAVRGEATEPVLRLRVKNVGNLAAVLSTDDFRALGLAPPPNEMKVRALTRAEAYRRRAKNVALPAAGAVGVCAGGVGVFVGAPVVAVIGVAAGVPAIAVAAYKALKD